MAIIVLRTVKGTPLTNSEVDGNFSNINSEVGIATSNIGVLSNLTTTQKSNLVAAINELVLESTSSVGITGGTIGNVILSNATIVSGTIGNVSLSNVAITNSSLSNVSISGSILTNSTWQGNIISVTYTEAKVGNVANTAPIGTSITGNTLTILHQNSGVTGATYGNATLVPSFVVNATGHITSASNVAITVANSSITGNIMAGQLHPTGAAAGVYGNATLNAVFTLDNQGRISSASNVLSTVANSSITGNIMAGQLHPTGATAGTYGNAIFVPSIVIDNQGRISSASNVTLQVANSAISGNIMAGQLHPTGATAGSYGSSISIPTFVIDNQGRVTSASNIAISPGGVVAVGGATGNVLISNTAPISTTVSGNTLTFSLFNSGVTAATYGNATLVPSLVVDALGRITSASNVAVQLATTGVTAATYGNTLNIPSFTVNATGQLTAASNITLANTAPIGITASGSTTTLTLLASGVTAATYGNATLTPVIVVDAQGRITSASNVLHTVANSSITGNIMAGQLHPTGVTAATYGNATFTPVLVIDNQGRISSASNVLHTVANSSITGNIMAGQLHPTGATAATYGNTLTIPSIAVDNQGRISSASNVTLANTAPIIATAAASTVTFSHGISGVTAATYGNATLVPSFVVNNQGHITSASNVAITVANSSITGNIMAGQLHPTGVTAATYGNAINIPSIVIDNQGRITSASNISVSAGTTLTDQTSTTTTQYVLMNAASSGSQSTANVSTTKLYFVPSTGTLNATVFNSLSDVAVKENINPVMGGLETISKLVGVEFDWIDNGRKSAGVVAQDIEAVIPHLVDTDGKTGLKSVNYSGIIAYLIQSIKELDSRLKKYESKE